MQLHLQNTKVLPWKVAINALYLPCPRMFCNCSPTLLNKSPLLIRILQLVMHFLPNLRVKIIFLYCGFTDTKICVRNSNKMEMGCCFPTGAWTTFWMRSQPTERQMWWWPPIMRRPSNTPWTGEVDPAPEDKKKKRKKTTEHYQCKACDSVCSRTNELSLSPSENKVSFGQLLGMCDQISFPLGRRSSHSHS